MGIHERMESLADLYVAGGLEAALRREAEEHAAGCAACASLLSDAREFSAWARGSIAADAPPADLEDRLIARFRAAQPKKRRFAVGTRVIKLTSSVAAAVGLIFLGNLFVGQESLRELAQATTAYNRDFSAVDTLSDNASLSSAVRSLSMQSRTAAFRSRGDSFDGYFSHDLGDEGRRKALATSTFAEPEKLAELRRSVDDGIRAGTGGGGNGMVYGLMARTTPGAGQGRSESLGVNRLTELADKAALQQEAQAVDGLKRFGGTTNLVARGGGKSAPEPVPQPQDNRKIIRTGDVSLEVDSYDATYAKLNDYVTAEKGMISGANTQKMANGKIRATVTVRIPPERFEAFLAKLKEFGTVQNQTIGSQDITKAYIDLETRQKSKEILAERLRKLLAEGKGTVKELMEVEVQLGNTNEAIEQIKGELKYYDNQVGMSTVTLRLSEKDLGQPFEYIQTLQSNLALTAKDPDEIYVRAQKEITDAGGQVVDSKMTRQSDGSSTGTIRGRVDADKFPALREALKKLGTVTNDTVNQQKTAHGGQEGTPKADAPLRKEQAVIDLSISSPPLFVTRRSQILVETPEVESAYQNSRRAIEAAGGKIVDGSLTGSSGGASATLKAQVDVEKFAPLVESLKSAGKVKNANVNHVLPAVSSDGVIPLLRERAEIELALVSPPQLIGEENGIASTVRHTFAHSWAGLLWSIEKLFVGVCLAGPWLALLGVGFVVWRRVRRRKAAAPAPSK